MSENTNCSVCGAPANVHLTQISDNQVKRVHYCESCAAKSGALTGAMGIIAPIAEAVAAMHLASILTPGAGKPDAPAKTCPECGFTAGDFMKTRRLGCPACYKTFAEELNILLPKIQPGPKHRGKPPGGKTLRKTQLQAIATARAAMQDAVKKEAYEDAAKYRDEIRQLEASLEKTGK